MIWQCSEWQGASGYWYCNCTSNLSNDGAKWYVPARILNISPADFIKLIINKYGADIVGYNQERNFFHYAWTEKTKMRSFKNFINAEARKKNFLI